MATRRWRFWSVMLALLAGATLFAPAFQGPASGAGHPAQAQALSAGAGHALWHGHVQATDAHGPAASDRGAADDAPAKPCAGGGCALCAAMPTGMGPGVGAPAPRAWTPGRVARRAGRCVVPETPPPIA